MKHLFFGGIHPKYQKEMSTAVTEFIRLDPDTGHYDMLTSGDTIENHPVLSRDGQSLYYDAIGIAYGEAGQMLGKSPSEIMKLDLRRGEIESCKNLYNCLTFVSAS